MKLPEHRGSLVGALVVDEGDEVLAITAERWRHPHARSPRTALQRRGRDTMGVRLMALAEGDAVVGVARNAETDADEVDGEGEPDGDVVDEGVDAAVDEVSEAPGDAPEAPGATDPAATGDAGEARTTQTQADGADEEDA